MATARFTIGSILSAATETANTITSTMGAINTTVSMANAFVSKAAADQQLRYKASSVGSKQRILNEVALEMVANDDIVRAYTNGDQAKQDEFNKYLAQLEEATKNL